MFRGDIKQKILTGKLGKTITTFVLTTNFSISWLHHILWSSICS